MGAYLDEALKGLEKYGNMSDMDLAKLANSMPSNAEIDAMRQTNPSVTTGTMSDTDFQRMLMAQESLNSSVTPAAERFNALSDMNKNINLYPMSGILNSINNASVVGRNTVTPPNAYSQNTLSNVAAGNSNVSPYGLGLGQQMYGTGQMSDQEKQILGILGL